MSLHSAQGYGGGSKNCGATPSPPRPCPLMLTSHSFTHSTTISPCWALSTQRGPDHELGFSAVNDPFCGGSTRQVSASAIVWRPGGPWRQSRVRGRSGWGPQALDQVGGDPEQWAPGLDLGCEVAKGGEGLEK